MDLMLSPLGHLDAKFQRWDTHKYRTLRAATDPLWGHEEIRAWAPYAAPLLPSQ